MEHYATGELQRITEAEEDMLLHGSKPNEYVSDVIEPLPERSIMVEKANLTALVAQIHAVGGDYMHDAHSNINLLEARRTAEYLMLLTDGNPSAKAKCA